MPGKQHLPKRSGKENRMYEHIKESEEKRGHGDRAEEIAARTVNKHRREHHHRGGE